MLIKCAYFFLAAEPIGYDVLILTFSSIFWTSLSYMFLICLVLIKKECMYILGCCFNEVVVFAQIFYTDFSVPRDVITQSGGLNYYVPV